MSGKRAANRDGANNYAGGDKEDDARDQETNFEVTRTWDDLEEIDGNIAVTGISEAEKRKRYSLFLRQGRGQTVLTGLQGCSKIPRPSSAASYGTSSSSSICQTP